MYHRDGVYGQQLLCSQLEENENECDDGEREMCAVDVRDALGEMKKGEKVKIMKYYSPFVHLIFLSHSTRGLSIYHLSFIYPSS